MRKHHTRIFLLALASVVLVVSVQAQPQLGRRTSPVGKLFVAEAQGDTQITSGNRIFEGRQATAFDAPGTVVETQADSHSAIVYSNGTGLFVDSDTRVEIQRFDQEPFRPSLDAMDYEPSISQSLVFVARGFVGVCTGNMASGSSMTYSTPHAAVSIRGRKVGIRASAEETTVYLLDGDVTVRSGDRDIGGRILRPGEQALIRPGLAGQPASVTISPIPAAMLQSLDDRVSVACNARRTVSFESVGRGAGADPNDPSPAAAEEIVARPTVPAEVPPHLVVSPDRMPGTD